MLGQTVGKYRVISRLGRGGMGTVYKAVDETLGREVAIKRLNPDLTEHDVLKRFRAEAMTLARLNHPNIATLFELAEYDGEILMVMEFVRGETFESLCERLGAMPIGRAIELCSQVFDALSHAHRAGIVHRDLKPANLMLAESGIVKVMDFGLARMSGSEHLTNDGYMVGTPAYMSPEQVLGGEVDGRADLYAMGVVLYRLLSGQLPFKARSGIEMAHRQMYDQPTPVRQLRTELPGACETILLRALAKAPEDRFQTADEFRAALAPLSDTPATETIRSSLTGFASAELAKTVSMPAPFPTGASPLDMPTMTAISPFGGQELASAALEGSGETATVAAPAPAPPAAVAPAPPASGTPGPPAAAASAKRVPIGAVVAAALVLVTVPVAMFVWRGRSVPGDGASTATVAPPPAPAAAPSAAPAVVPEPSPQLLRPRRCLRPRRRLPGRRRRVRADPVRNRPRRMCRPPPSPPWTKRRRHLRRRAPRFPS
jgi:serine/threonine-protein kinase